MKEFLMRATKNLYMINFIFRGGVAGSQWSSTRKAELPRAADPRTNNPKRSNETKWRPREDARLKAGRQRRTEEPHNISTVRCCWSTEKAPGTCAGPGSATRTSGKGDRRRELGRRARPEGDVGETLREYGKDLRHQSRPIHQRGGEAGEPGSRGPRDSKRTQRRARGAWEIADRRP
ncbi:hypothetical protein NDU88_004567 [Pleurodeles waltl]|uniref:Uncharacterized protein n=1 Tax=Pleurodeles waltl TaxID=8319 RepID=A0AAV7T8G8_PLEWA|nr:hypothetical protein NDU88_004567 [Pleurodeles waltl]